MAWSSELDDLLVAYCKQGLSATQIAARIGGGMTRNAVIGRIHRLQKLRPDDLRQWMSGPRLGKYQPPKLVREAPRPAPPIKPKINLPKNPQLAVRNYPTPTLVVPENAPNDIEPVEFMQLGRRMCKWPVENKFCGHPTDNDPSYCPFHRRMATGEQPRRRIPSKPYGA